MLGFPLFAEQHHNAFRMVDHGLGIRMDINSFSEEDIVNNINQLLSNLDFRDQVQFRSAVIRDRPMDAQQTAAFWINHVIEFGGSHLRSTALDMVWYKYYMLDIILFVVSLFTVFPMLIIVVITNLFKCCSK